MDVKGIIAVIGGIALLVGLLGGGIKAKEVEVPLIPGLIRIFSAILGACLISLSVWLTIQPPSQGLLTPTTTPAAIASSTPTPTTEILY